MSGNNKKRPGTNHILRICAGAYLVYLAWSLAGETAAGASPNLWLGALAAALFAVVGVVLIIMSGRALYRQKKEETEETEENND